MTAVFCYGTLEFPEVMQAVTGRVFTSRRATLADYGRYLLKGADYPGLVIELGARTDGALYTGLDAESMRRLDRYEDKIYIRKTVTVRTEDESECLAETYVIPAHKRWALSARPWDREVFARRHLKSFLARLDTIRGPRSSA